MKAIPIFRMSGSTDTWARIDIPFAHLLIANDSVANPLAISFDANNNHFVLYNETIELRDLNIDVVYVKSYNLGASAAYRLLAYGDKKTLYGDKGVVGDNNALDPNFNPYSFQKTLLGR